MRDVIAYLIVLAVIVAVAYDGKVCVCVYVVDQYRVNGSVNVRMKMAAFQGFIINKKFQKSRSVF